MKGMQKISRGRGFRGALDYAFERDSKDAEPGRLLGGNMSGQNARQLAAEFGQVRRLRPDIEKPVWHNALRLPKGETLNDPQWVAIADDYMRRMGFAETHPRAYVLHDDADGQHIHIVACRVSTEGKVYLGKNENLASTRHIQALEREHGLTITKGPTYDPETGKIVMPGSRQLKKGEVEMALRTEAEPPRQQLQRLIDDALADKPTAPQFAERLTAAGITVRANVAGTGRCNGFGFELDGVAFKGSDLGKAYGWKGLQERGLNYEQDRDRQELGRYRAGAQPSSTATTGKNLAAADGDLRAARGAAANIDRTAGNIADRAARRAVGAYLKSAIANRSKATLTTTGEAMNTATTTSQNLCSIECDEPLDKRQKYKAKILEDRYKAEIDAALARRLAYVKTGDNKLTIGLQDDEGKPSGKLIDSGDRITAGSGNDKEIEAMLELARAKRWKNIKFGGSDDFVKRASQAAADAGFEIKGYKPSKPQPAGDLMEALAELTSEIPEQSASNSHEQARLAARQRVRDELDSSPNDLVQQATAKREANSSYQPSLAELKAIDAVLIEQARDRIQEATVPDDSCVDPCARICRTELERVQAKLGETKAELARTQTHDINAIQRAALVAAQDNLNNAYLMEPVRHLHLKRQAAQSQLAHEQKRHAERGWLAKMTNAGKLKQLEHAAAEAKAEHVSLARVVKQKLMASEGVRGPVKSAEYENQRHATLTDQIARLECEAQDLQALERRLRNADGEGKTMLQRLQRDRVLDPAERRVLDLVRSQEQAQRHAEELRREQELAEKQQRAQDTLAEHLEHKPQGLLPTP